jgi:viroplasmin and RNaseH domain-containing protein
MSYIEKEKLLEWLNSHAERVHPNDYFHVIRNIESGTFDLTPTDVDVKEIEEALNKPIETEEELGELQSNAIEYCAKLLTLLSEEDKETESLKLENGALLRSVRAQEAEVERYYDGMLRIAKKLNQAVEALEDVADVYISESCIEENKLLKACKDKARETLQSIKGEQP